MKHLKERAHSRFSASGAERWLKCSGSVALSEGLPDKSSPEAEEGTKGHAVLETILNGEQLKISPPIEMLNHAQDAAKFLSTLHARYINAEFLVETRVHLSFIDDEAFGTFDSSIVDHFGTLHVFDYKYGKHTVSPIKNLQMIFYGLGLAYRYQWNFKRVRLWIIQPRIRGYDGPVFWELSILELKKYIEVFTKGIENVRRYPNRYVEGPHCFFCKAKSICPLKQKGKLDKAMSLFQSSPLKGK